MSSTSGIPKNRYFEISNFTVASPYLFRFAESGYCIANLSRDDKPQPLSTKIRSHRKGTGEYLPEMGEVVSRRCCISWDAENRDRIKGPSVVYSIDLSGSDSSNL